MNFANGLKKLFGVSDNNGFDDDIEYYGSGHPAYVNPFKKDEKNEDDNEPQYSPIETLPETELNITLDDEKQGQILPQETIDAFVELLNGIAVSTREKTLAKATEKWGEQKKDIVERLATADKAASSADERLKELKERLAETDAQRKAAQAQVTTLQEQVKSYEAEKEQFEIENKSLQNKMKVMQVKGEINDEDVQLADEVVNLKKQIKDLEEEYRQKSAINTELVNSLRGDDAAKTQQIAALQQKLKDFEALSIELKEQLNEANENLQIAEEIQRQIEDLQQLIERKNQEIVALKEDKVLAIEQAKKQALALAEKDKQAVEGERDDALAKIGELEKEIVQLNKTAKQKALTRHERDVETANTIDRLKSQLNEVKVENIHLKKSLGNQSNAGNELNQELADAKQLVQTLERDLKETKDSLSRSKLTTEQDTKQIENLKQELKERDRRLNETMAELDKVLKENKKLQQTPPEAVAQDPGVNSQAQPMQMLDNLDDIDWLSTNTENGNEDPNDDKRQMSLF